MTYPVERVIQDLHYGSLYQCRLVLETVVKEWEEYTVEEFEKITECIKMVLESRIDVAKGKQRSPGFYWVKDGEDWVVAEWILGENISYWEYRDGTQQDSDWTFISESPIVAP